MSTSLRKPRSVGNRSRIAVGAVAICALLSACGGSSDDASSDAADSADTEACVESATQAVEAAKAPIKADLPTESVDMAALSGETFWFISPNQASAYAAAVSEAFETAGEAAGLDTQVFNGQSKPDLYNQGIEQAVASGAAGIILYGINPEVVPNALKAAQDAGIPVVAAATGVPNPTDGTVAATVSVDLVEEGKQMADYALMVTECRANALLVLDPNLMALTTQRDAVKARFEEACPDTCKVTDLETNLATMATQLQTQTASALLRDQSVNVGISTFDAAATYMEPAFAESEVDLVSTNGLPGNLDVIRNGGAQIADVSYPPAEYVGWILVDQLARVALDQEATSTTLPMQLFDTENIPASNELDVLWPSLVGFDDDLKALWGL